MVRSRDCISRGQATADLAATLRRVISAGAPPPAALATALETAISLGVSFSAAESATALAAAVSAASQPSRAASCARPLVLPHGALAQPPAAETAAALAAAVSAASQPSALCTRTRASGCARVRDVLFTLTSA